MSDEKEKDTNTSLSKPIAALQHKKTGIAAQRQQAMEVLKNFNPLNYANRIGIVFDDSGSMSGQAIKQAKKAIDAFLRSCNPQDTCVGVYPFTPSRKVPLTINFTAISIAKESWNADTGTPLYTTMKSILNENPINRCCVFSDGEPTDNYDGKIEIGSWIDKQLVEVCDAYVAKKVTVDTVYIGNSEHDSGAKLLKEIASRTGGIFIFFKDETSFANNFKYLAPAFRAMLVNEDIKKRIANGETI